MENMNMENIKGKKVLIVGLGKSGIAATKAMLKLGAEVAVQDSKEMGKIDGQLLNYLESRKVKCYFNCLPELNKSFDMIILSPGVDPEMDFIKREEAQGAEITGELEIAYRIARGNFVAITGTNGKTTTTTLVGEMFRNAKKPSHVVGNIGIAVISKALESKEEDWLITETSSFQLQTIKYFKPRISAILNLTPDHLNRHHTMEEYGAAKARIWENQDAGGFLIMNRDDEASVKLCLENIKERPKAKVLFFSRKEEVGFGAFMKDDVLFMKDEAGSRVEICHRNELQILGDHNVENALAAIAIAYLAGIDKEVIRDTLLKFTGVEHRMEYVGAVDGVRFYNDSKGTNVDSSTTAIKAVGKDIILIAGGDGKGQDFEPLFQDFAGKVKHMVLMGRDKDILAKTAHEKGFDSYTLCKDMEDSVKTAFSIAEKGDNILLSPACASWDMYDNFEQRGNHFKDCVRRLEE